jgi:hypothetical protein
MEGICWFLLVWSGQAVGFLSSHCHDHPFEMFIFFSKSMEWVAGEALGGRVGGYT